MDLKALKIAWTLPWRSTWRCRAVIGLIRWSRGCRTAWVVRHCWLLVCLAHLRPTILQRNIDQKSFTLSVSWATLIFSNMWTCIFRTYSSIWTCMLFTTYLLMGKKTHRERCLAPIFLSHYCKIMMWCTLFQTTLCSLQKRTGSFRNAFKGAAAWRLCKLFNQRRQFHQWMYLCLFYFQSWQRFWLQPFIVNWQKM